MARKMPKDSNRYSELAELPEYERRVVGAYIYCRTWVKGCKPGEMTPAELMAWLTSAAREEDAA